MASTQAGTLRLSEDDKGLAVQADLDMASPWAQTVASAVRRGDMDEMSFGFQVTKDEWDEDFENRELLEVRLFEVSTVPRGANDATVGEVERSISVPDAQPVEEDEITAPAPDVASVLYVRQRFAQYPTA